FNGDLKARRFLIQMKEIANKMSVCNIHRFLLSLIVEVFYRAQIFQLLENPYELVLIILFFLENNICIGDYTEV
ncbi:MAG: hypothetical protein ABFC71_08800, partial [Methanoregula sp.]